MPIRGSEMFYGRQKDIAYLVEALTQYNRVIILHHSRRAGGTALLMQLHNTLIQLKHVTVFIDMQQFSITLSINQFLYEITHRISNLLEKRMIEIVQSESMMLQDDPTSTFDAFLNEVKRQLPAQQIILLLDEYDILNKEAECIQWLHDQVKRHNIRLLLAGSHSLQKLNAKPWSLLLNSAKNYRLPSSLDPQSATDLITQPLVDYIQYDPSSVNKLHELTADQPYLLNIICSVLVDYCNKTHKSYVAIIDIDKVLDEIIIVSQAYFTWQWSQLIHQERLLLASLVKVTENINRQVSLAEIEVLYLSYGIPYKHEDVIISLQSLVNFEIVQEILDEAADESSKQIPPSHIRARLLVGLFRIWLRMEKPLERLIREEKNDS